MPPQQLSPRIWPPRRPAVAPPCSPEGEGEARVVPFGGEGDGEACCVVERRRRERDAVGWLVEWRRERGAVGWLVERRRERDVRLQTLRGIYTLSGISGQDGLFGLQVGPVFFEAHLIVCPPHIID